MTDIILSLNYIPFLLLALVLVLVLLYKKYKHSHFLSFKTAILAPSDILYLTKTLPSNEDVNTISGFWHYELIKKTKINEKNPFNLSFEIYFQKNKG